MRVGKMEGKLAAPKIRKQKEGAAARDAQEGDRDGRAPRDGGKTESRNFCTKGTEETKEKRSEKGLANLWSRKKITRTHNSNPFTP